MKEVTKKGLILGIIVLGSLFLAYACGSSWKIEGNNMNINVIKKDSADVKTKQMGEIPQKNVENTRIGTGEEIQRRNMGD